LRRFSEFKNSLSELYWILKTVLQTIWFWVPILYAVYFVIQLWMIFFIHPLTVLIVAAVLGFYGIWLEDKRTTARYAIKKTKYLAASHAFGVGPELIERSELEIEKAVEEYQSLLNKKGQKNKRKTWRF